MGVPQAEFDPPIDTLQEIKIMANGFSAEFGASAGGVVVANTKSGTNSLKGSLFEYFRNEVLDAPNFFSPVADGREAAPLAAVQRVRRDRRRAHSPGQDVLLSLVSKARAAEMARCAPSPSPPCWSARGDFSQTFTARGLAAIYDPVTSRQQGNAVVRDPFPGNRLPEARIDPVARKTGPVLPRAEPSGRRHHRGQQLPPERRQPRSNATTSPSSWITT